MSIDVTMDAPLAPEAAMEVPLMRRFYWSLRRELWEYRSLYLVPLGMSALVLIGSLIGLVTLPDKLRAATALDPVQQQLHIQQPYAFAALLLMGSTFLVAVFYCLDTLYGERRDRSILFWKSLPVSDVTTVLAKASIPIIFLPVVTLLVTVATWVIMFLLASVRLAGTGLSVGLHLSFAQMSATLFYHLILGHGLWYAPIWGWLLFCSAWAKRVPFLWATLPLLAVGLVEKIAFNTSHFANWIGYRFMTGPDNAPHRESAMVMITSATPAQFLTSPGLWVGLALAAGLLLLAVRLRREHGPI